MRRLFTIIGLLVLLVTSVSATAVSAQEGATYVGRVDGTDGFIAVVTDGNGALAYFCDGTANSDWFPAGPLFFGKAELRSESGAVLVVQVAETGVTGTLQRTGDQVRSFATEVASGDAGLYRGEFQADGVSYIAGQIVLANGEFRGLAWGSDRQSYVPTRVAPGAPAREGNARFATSSITRGSDLIQFEAERLQFGLDRVSRD